MSRHARGLGRPELPRSTRAVSLSVALALVLAGCSGPTEDSTGPLSTGRLIVLTMTGGESPAPNGYTIRIDDETVRVIGANDTITISGISEASHSVALVGVPANCVVDDNPRSIAINRRVAATTPFVVMCGPATGNLPVRAVTKGDDLDPDGYVIVIDDDTVRAIGVNEEFTIPIREGRHDVALVGVAANCAVDGPGRQSVVIQRGSDEVGAWFVVTCTPITLVRMVEISAGTSHTCARTSAGAVYCWGSNGFGQLGDGTTTAHTRPALVSGDVAFTQISAGAGFTCGRTADGAVYCWGSNSFGQLGDGTTNDLSVPTRVNTTVSFVEVRVARDNGDYFSARGGCENYTGCGHTCALTAAGAAYCWGSNNYGELGDSTFSPSRGEPAPVTGNLTFGTISVGGGHTCGVTLEGVGYCWGYSFSGQAGTGGPYDFDSWSVPKPVTGSLVFAQVSAGIFHSCGLTTSAGAYCWGFNGTGQVGNGSHTDPYEANIYSLPTAVRGGVTFAQLTTGLFHSCGLATSGLAYCWGYNGVGALGDGTWSDRLAPTRVARDLTFTALSAGWDHTCGLRAAGTVYCWGYNTSGQLGDGTDTTRVVPTHVRT